MGVCSPSLGEGRGNRRCFRASQIHPEKFLPLRLPANGPVRKHRGITDDELDLLHRLQRRGLGLRLFFFFVPGRYRDTKGAWMFAVEGRCNRGGHA